VDTATLPQLYKDINMKCVFPDLFGVLASGYLALVSPETIPQDFKDFFMKEAAKVCQKSCPEAGIVIPSMSRVDIVCAEHKEVRQ